MIWWERFKGYAWAAGCIGASVLVIAVTVALVLTARQRDRLDRAINTPVTGYVAKLAQCQTNLANVRVAVDAQNAAVAEFQADSTRRLAEAQKATQAALRGTETAKKRAAAVLSRKGSGDLCRSAEMILRGNEG